MRSVIDSLIMVTNEQMSTKENFQSRGGLLHVKKIFMSVLLSSLFVFTIAHPQASAQIADGTHSLNYQVNQPNSNSASIANDYFLKPAKVTVENGSATVQITLKNSSWITKFQPPGGATVISEDKGADTRVVQFTVKDISKPVKIAMKVDVEDINYHHEYTVDAVFDAAATGGGAATNGATPTGDKTSATSESASEGQVPNPQTSDSTPYLIILTLVGSAFLLYRNKQQTKQGEQ